MYMYIYPAGQIFPRLHVRTIWEAKAAQDLNGAVWSITHERDKEKVLISIVLKKDVFTCFLSTIVQYLFFKYSASPGIDGSSMDMERSLGNCSRTGRRRNRHWEVVKTSLAYRTMS